MAIGVGARHKIIPSGLGGICGDRHEPPHGYLRATHRPGGRADFFMPRLGFSRHRFASAQNARDLATMLAIVAAGLYAEISGLRSTRETRFSDGIIAGGSD